MLLVDKAIQKSLKILNKQRTETVLKKLFPVLMTQGRAVLADDSDTLICSSLKWVPQSRIFLAFSVTRN